MQSLYSENMFMWYSCRSLLVPDFTNSVYGSSCNDIFFCLLPLPIALSFYIMVSPRKRKKRREKETKMRELYTVHEMPYTKLDSLKIEVIFCIICISFLYKWQSTNDCGKKKNIKPRNKFYYFSIYDSSCILCGSSCNSLFLFLPHPLPSSLYCFSL